MKALVWGAGFGTRLKPLTDILPKPLIPIANIPIINLIIRYLKSEGIGGVGVNTHYLSDLLIPHLKTIKDTEIYITEEKEEILGTGGGTVQFKDFLKDEEFFIVHTCDILSNLPLKDAVNFHRINKNIATFIIVDYEPINHVSLLEDGTIVDIRNELGRRKDPFVKNLAGSGLVIYSKEIFNWLPDEKNYFEINPTVLKIIKEKPGKIKGYIAPKTCYWRDIGTPGSYLEAHRDIILNNLFKIKEIREKEKHIIHPTGDISPGVKFNGFVVTGKNVKLRGNFEIKNSIIWDNTELSGDKKIENSVITGDLTVKI